MNQNVQQVVLRVLRVVLQITEIEAKTSTVVSVQVDDWYLPLLTLLLNNYIVELSSRNIDQKVYRPGYGYSPSKGAMKCQKLIRVPESGSMFVQ